MKVTYLGTVLAATILLAAAVSPAGAATRPSAATGLMVGSASLDRASPGTAPTSGGLAPPPGLLPDSTELVSWYEGLRTLRADPRRGATVSDLVLTRDVGRFELRSGTVHLLTGVTGRTFGAVFSGDGLFSMTVPDPVEAAHLQRAYEWAPEPTVGFENAVFLFTDFTLVELEQALTWEALEPSDDAEEEVEELVEYITDDDGWIDRKVGVPLVNGGPGFFYAHFSEDRDNPMVFVVDPGEEEEVELYTRAEGPKRRWLMSSFHRQADYSTGRSIPQEALDVIRIHHYDIETRIDDDLDLTGRATATLTRAQAAYDWIPFSLHSELEVDSVRWADGTPVPHYRPEDRSDLWLDLSSMPGDTARITFHYAGDMMDRPRDLWVQMGSRLTWHPVYRAGRLIPYTLTFHTENDYVVTTVGRRTEHRVSGDWTTAVYETPPVRHVTFNIGEFEALESEPPRPGDPSLTVLINERAHDRLGGMVSEAGGYLLEQRDMKEMVALDLRNSFTFFNEVFGPTTVDDFVATEIPQTLGVAYPGLVLLAWSTFQWTSSKGFDEMFRAHEVAHQWWGIGVRPATYRDRWISEGFAEFAGWWYAARAKGSMDMYLRRLETTREEILDRRGESAPIALGTRAVNERHPGDYQMTVYHKGAWVLHMLRNLMTDLDTGNDDAFTEMMRSFYTENLGGTASTVSFQRAVEEALGGSMQWFFDQWVYGSDIPTYVFSHKYEDTPDGSVLATVRVRQEGVPDDFRMYVPILLDFGDEGTATVRVNVTGPVTEVELPLLPREPQRIELNPFEAVLAETKTEGW